MPSPRTLTPLVCLALMSCGAPKGAGAFRIDPLPASLASPCDHPSAYLGAGDWRLIAGRLGDALIVCGKKQAAVVARDAAILAAITEVAR